MAERKGKPPKDDDNQKKGRRKPYVAPVLIIAGSLLTISKSALFAAQSLCCLSQRLQLAKRSPDTRARLVRDVADMMAGA